MLLASTSEASLSSLATTTCDNHASTTGKKREGAWLGDDRRHRNQNQLLVNERVIGTDARSTQAVVDVDRDLIRSREVAKRDR